ncbi:MAG: threonine--tRNA ligase [Bacteroidota bacterium]
MAQQNVKIVFPNGSEQNYPLGITGAAIARSISPQLAKKALSILVNGFTQDLSRSITTDATVQILTWEHDKAKQVFWHSSAHLLAEAIEALYPNVHLGMGPPVANGFYYDVDLRGHQLDASGITSIEKKMKELAAQRNSFHRIPISKKEAVAHYQKKLNPYKLEILERLEDGQITFYQQGNFTDLCKGTHIPHTGLIKAVKITNIAGAYWRGDVKRKQLTRIYGISFPKESMLQDYERQREEAVKRDHRKIGKELELFTFSEDVGIGLPLWLPKGTFIREQLVSFLKAQQYKADYQPVVTPHIAHKKLYVRSGHYDKYQNDTFRPIQTPQAGETFMLKPMNCPHHCAIYQASPKSYKELPLRLAEFGTVYRYEQHGELHGITRTRGFTQDDAHIFCTAEQVKGEFAKVVDLVLDILKKFAFQHYEVQIAVRDRPKQEQYIGDPSHWDKAEKAIQEVVQARSLQAHVVPGEAAFYGPKLDFIVHDALGRKWQMGTIQLDYQLPERFDLTYVGEDNQKHRPVMIHRAPFGSLERFIAILLEHTAGKLPLWLVPTQVVILPIGKAHVSFATAVVDQLNQQGIRAKLDERDEKISRKIRDAEVAKVPYMAIVGDQEVSNKQLALRKQGAGQQGMMTIEQLIKELNSKE